MRKLLLIGIFFLMVNEARSQEGPQPVLRFRAGVMLGLNASQIDGDNYAGYHKLGVNGGFIAQIPISPKFFISTEILYSQKGSKSKSYPDVPLEFLLRLHYAEIPILFNFQEKSAINFGAGFAYARLVKSYLEVDPFLQPYPELEFNKSDFTVLANANYMVTQHFAINVRFAYSIVPVGHNLYSNYKNKSMYNNVLTFRLGYIF